MDELGWVYFEPTASGSPSRTPGFHVEETDAEDGEEGEGSDVAAAGDAQSAIPESARQAIESEIEENLDILDEDSGVGIFNLETAPRGHEAGI